MRARDAENLIAELLTNGKDNADLENQITEPALLGLRRSQPIYARKIKEKEKIAQRRRFLFCRRMLSVVTYPVRMLIHILRTN